MPSTTSPASSQRSRRARSSSTPQNPFSPERSLGVWNWTLVRAQLLGEGGDGVVEALDVSECSLIATAALSRGRGRRLLEHRLHLADEPFEGLVVERRRGVEEDVPETELDVRRERLRDLGSRNPGVASSS